jgi:hypothetical protein
VLAKRLETDGRDPRQSGEILTVWNGCTTNSIHQTFNRRVLEPFVAAVSNRQVPLHLAYAIPDHPWIDSADGAAVRIAMTVAAPGHAAGILEKVVAVSGVSPRIATIQPVH